MAKKQHTPGPWRYIAQAPSKLDRVGTAMVATTHSGGLAIDCHGSGRSWEEDAANARLIAAAPDLLSIARRWAALDGGVWNVSRYEREREELLAETSAAIDKASGEQP